jgi:CPA2 family monovalent cation:H+ antiporter-2
LRASLIPWLLNQVARIKKREAFVLSIMLLCLGTAVATSHFGLSMALGAFIAGLVISDSKFSHQALAEVLPIRESAQLPGLRLHRYAL